MTKRVHMLSRLFAVIACVLSVALAVCDPEHGVCGPAADGRLIVVLVLGICVAWLLATLLPGAADPNRARSQRRAKENS